WHRGGAGGLRRAARRLMSAPPLPSPAVRGNTSAQETGASAHAQGRAGVGALLRRITRRGRARACPLAAGWLAPLAVLTLAACGASGDTGGGSLELAVSAGCAPDSAPECIAVGAGYVLEPSGYEAAEVSSAEIVDGASIAVELDAAGAEVLEELSREAAGAEDARLLIRAGDEI